MSQVETVSIGPEEAATLLGGNTRNRRVNAATVAAYAIAMSNDRWSGLTLIQFAEDGTLVDGQHRLLAVIRSGRTIQFIVNWSSAIEHQVDIDTQMKRSLSGQLQIAGEPYATSLAPVLRATARWDAGARRLVLASSSFTSPTLGSVETGYPRIAQALAIMDRNPEEFRKLAKLAKRATEAVGGSASIHGLMYYLFSHIDQADADDFFSRLMTGGDLSAGSPILRFRDSLVARRTARDKRPAVNILAEGIKAWNAYREGREPQSLAFRAGGSAPEAFPEPR